MTLVKRQDVGGGVTVVELDDPERYNALSNQLVRVLRATLAEIAEDRSVRAVVLTGAGTGLLRRRQHDRRRRAQPRGARTVARSASSR